MPEEDRTWVVVGFEAVPVRSFGESAGRTIAGPATSAELTTASSRNAAITQVARSTPGHYGAVPLPPVEPVEVVLPDD